MVQSREAPHEHGAGILDAVLHGGLRRRSGTRTLPFAPTLFDAELLAAADAAAVSRRPLGVLLPFPSTRAAVVIGTAMLVAEVQRIRSLDVEVAIVSPRLAARTLYEELAYGVQKLSDFIPRTSVGPDGAVRVTGDPKAPTRGRLHFAHDVERLSAVSGQISGLVVDSRSEGPSVLRRVLGSRQGTPIVYLFTNPFDVGLDAVIEAGGLVWGWDQDALDQLAPLACDPRTADSGPLIMGTAAISAVAHAKITIAPGTGSEAQLFDAALRDAWFALGRLARTISKTDVSSVAALRWAWSAFSGIDGCPVRPEDRDRYIGANPYALVLGEAPATARSYARATDGAARSAWYEVAEGLDRLLEAANSGVRFRQVESWVNTMTESAVDGLVMVGGRSDREALSDALAESPNTRFGWDSLVRVVTRSELRRLDPAELTVVSVCSSGPLPRSYAGWLAVPPCRELVVLSSGDFETERLSRQVSAAKVGSRDVVYG